MQHLTHPRQIGAPSHINTNLLVASFASTAAGAIYDAMGSYTAVFILLFVHLALSFAFFFAIRKP